jgi:polyphenol oxidase
MPRHAAAAAADWIVPEWPVAARVRAFVTTRNGGVSRGPYASFNVGGGGTDRDEPAAVVHNRRLLTRHLPRPPTWLTQVHGTAVATLAAPVAAPPTADAAVTRTPEVPLAVRIADCLPVFLAERGGAVVGVAHAGWRGLASGVVERTVEAMNAAPASLVAWLGPAIGVDAFEVGDDVRRAFTRHDRAAAACFTAERFGKWRADLVGLARLRLAACGVADVHGGSWCTVRDPARFYSYRRDGATGRMAAVIWIDAEQA